MNRDGEYDFPAPPPMNGEFEEVPLSEPEWIPITGQPERIATIGQHERPRGANTIDRVPYPGRHDRVPITNQPGRVPMSRETEGRYGQDEANVRRGGQSKTMPRSGQPSPMYQGDQVRMASKHRSPAPYADQYGQRPPPRSDLGTPPPVAQKPTPRQAFNYLGQQNAIKSPRDWSSGLCSCCSDMKSCCGVLWCGCFFYPCYLSKKLGENTCLPLAMGSTCALISLRTKVRTQTRINGTICKDCCTVVCCQCCAMCQMSREQTFVTNHRMV